MAKIDVGGKLTETERAWVIAAASQACEAAYRRGFQQGARLATIPGAIRVDLHKWRFATNKDKAVGPDGGGPMGWTATDRFACEPRQYDPFVNLGFQRPRRITRP